MPGFRCDTGKRIARQSPEQRGEAEEKGEALSLLDIFHAPLDARAVGLTGAVKPDPARPGASLLAMTIDLKDIQLQPRGRSLGGSLQVSMRLESKEGETLVATQPVTDTVRFNLTNAEFEAATTLGFASHANAAGNYEGRVCSCCGAGYGRWRGGIAARADRGNP